MSQTSILEHISDVVLKDPEELDYKTYQPRIDTVVDDAFLESFRSTRGNLTPILITESNQIVSGHRRAQACKQLGYPVSCRILPKMSEAEYWELAILENIAREDMTTYEEVLAIRKLLDSGLSTRKIRKKVGMSVGRINALANCSTDEHLLELVKDGMSIYTVSRLKNLPLDVRKRVLGFGWGDKELQKYVSLYEHAKHWEGFNLLYYASYASAEADFKKFRERYYKEKYPYADFNQPHAQWHNAALDPLRKANPDKVCGLCGDVVDGTRQKQLLSCKVCNTKYCTASTKWHMRLVAQHLHCKSCGKLISSGDFCLNCDPKTQQNAVSLIQEMKNHVEIPKEEEEKLKSYIQKESICFRADCSQPVYKKLQNDDLIIGYCEEHYDAAWRCERCGKLRHESKIIVKLQEIAGKPNLGICRKCNDEFPEGIQTETDQLAVESMNDPMDCGACQTCGLCEGCKSGGICELPYARSCHSCKKTGVCELFDGHIGKCLTYREVLKKRDELEKKQLFHLAEENILDLVNVFKREIYDQARDSIKRFLNGKFNAKIESFILENLKIGKKTKLLRNDLNKTVHHVFLEDICEIIPQSAIDVSNYEFNSAIRFVQSENMLKSQWLKLYAMVCPDIRNQRITVYPRLVIESKEESPA